MACIRCRFALAQGKCRCALPELREDAWGVMDYERSDPSGRSLVRAIREEFEKIHGPQKWRVAL